MKNEDIIKNILVDNIDDAKSLVKIKPTAILIEQQLLNPIIHVGFDWDSTLASDHEDKIINTLGRPEFEKHEWLNRHVPHQSGPMYPLMLALLKNNCKISILTARNGKESHRIMTTLEYWNVKVDSLICCSSHPKGPFAKALNIDIFFDDILRNIHSVKENGVLAAWVPFGEATQ